jgi:diguanylate cyclase (GGDEF)-like protein/PAS domain S-box-containing protein
VLIIASNFFITKDKIEDLQYELLVSNVSQVVSRSEFDYKTLDALGMANVGFYQAATQKGVMLDIEKNLAPGTSISIIDAKRKQVIFSAGNGKEALPLDVPALVQMLEQADHDTKHHIPLISGERLNTLTATGAYPNWNWLIVSYVGKDQLYQYIYEAMTFSLTLAAVCLFFIFIGVYQLSNSVSRAIVLLQKGAQRLSKNDFDNKIKIKGDSEFASLANSFNTMGQEIQQTQDRLTKSILEEQRVNQFLKISEQRQSMALLGADLGLWDYDLLSNSAVYDLRWWDIIGLPANDTPQNVENWRQLLHPEDAPAIYAALQANFSGESTDYEQEFRMLHKDGHWVWVLAKGRVVERDDNDAPLRMTGTHMDISLRKHNEISLHRAASVFKHSHEGILITGLDGGIIDVNDACLQITGFSRAYLLGKHQQVFRPDEQATDNTTEISTTLKKVGYWYGEIVYRHKAGGNYTVRQATSAVTDDKGEVQHYVSLFSDITELKKHQQQLEHLAHFDVLTDLPNRAMLSEFLQHSMEQEQRRESNLAVIYLDLDGFKLINDRHGHKVGDQLLITLAARMKGVLRKGDLLARIGGDEFVAVLVDLDEINNSETTISRLLEAAASPIVVSELELKVSASLGVSFYPQVQKVDADQVLRQADQAMYQAKISGKNGYHIFDSELDRSIRGQHENIERIFLALERREFVLFYQPKVNMRTGEVVGAEALIRWLHPEKGLLTPDHFLPVIENHSLAMISIGEWVTETALTQMELWQADGLDMPVSVNIDALHLQQSNFIERQRFILAAHPLIPSFQLEMEILETSELDDVVQTAKVINACKKLGVLFALDDFGTGYSSLTYLRRLDVRLIKIDQSFVRDMLDDPDDLAIITGVISLAAALQRDVIAEGVETVAHGSRLLELGCDLAQGYGIAKPMAPDTLPNWCENWQPDPSWAAQK